MITDFHKIRDIVTPIIEELDHKCLNDILELDTTSENICQWIAMRAKRELVNVCRVTLWETESCGAVVEL